MNGMSSLFDPAMSQLITIEVADDVAIETTRQLIRMGYPVGPSSGRNVAAAIQLQELYPKRFHHVVTVFPDRMERYFSTELFRENSQP